MVSEIGPVLKQLFAAYPTTNVGEDTVAVYVRLLQDIPSAALQQSVDQCILECSFLPSVAEIRQQWEKQKRDSIRWILIPLENSGDDDGTS